MTTKTAHSPGPWTADKCFGGDCIDYCIVSGGSIIASTMGTTYIDGETDIANAKLITAAPDMLEALEKVWATPYALNEWIDEVQAAIQKAGCGR